MGCLWLLPRTQTVFSEQESHPLNMCFHHHLVGSFLEAGGVLKWKDKLLNKNSIKLLGEKCNCYQQSMSALWNAIYKKDNGWRLSRVTGPVLPGGWNLKGHEVVPVIEEESTWLLQQTAHRTDAGLRISLPSPSDTAMPCFHLRCPPLQRGCTWKESIAHCLQSPVERRPL